jgi:hypothetical protein
MFARVAALGVGLVACDYASDRNVAPAPEASTPASVAAPPPAPPKPTPNEQFARASKSLATPWNAHNAVGVGALFEEHAKLLVSGFPIIEERSAIVADAAATFARTPDLKIALTRTFLHGSDFVFQWVTSGTDKATGRPTGLSGISFVQFDDDGLIKEEHRYFDVPTLQSQLDPKAKAGTFRPPPPLPTGPVEAHLARGTAEEAKALQTANAFYKAFESKGDITPFLTDATTSDDYTAPATVKGIKANKDLAAGYWKTFPDLEQVKPFQFVADGFVITEGVLTGTQKGPLGPVKPTNKQATLHFVDVIEIKDGKIVHLDTYGNSAEILVAIGAMPRPTLAK